MPRQRRSAPVSAMKAIRPTVGGLRRLGVAAPHHALARRELAQQGQHRPRLSNTSKHIRTDDALGGLHDGLVETGQRAAYS